MAHKTKMGRNPVGFKPEKKPIGPILWNPMDFFEGFEFEKSKIPEAKLEEIPPVCLTQRPLPVIGEEVGDDRRDLSKSDDKLRLALWTQSEVFKMKTSKEDTFISSKYWNFCEITSVIPFSPYGSFDMARRAGDFNGLDFIDVPPLRIIMDVSKGDGSHSSSANGKAQMLASRSSTPRNEFRVILQLSHWLQDSHLNTFRSTDPKYMPRILGGSGAKALFDNLKNMWLYMIAYRGGGYDRVYGSATQELFSCVQTMSEQSVITEPVLCRFLRDKQEYLHGTYASSVLVPQREKPATLPMPAYERAGSTNLYRCYENRLVRTHQLIGETNALREWERTTRLRDILRNHKSIMDYENAAKSKTNSLRRNFERSLNSNAEFKRLLDKTGNLSDVATLISNGWYDVKFGVVCLTLRQCEWIFHGMKCPSGVFTAEDLTQSEDMFFRDEVSEEESLRVPGVPLRPIGRQEGRLLLTKAKMGLYQISEPMLDWSRNLCERIRATRDSIGTPVPLESLKTIFTGNPEWVNDDTGIIGQAIDLSKKYTSAYKLILVSSDQKLASQVARQANVGILRISPRDLIRAVPKENLGPQANSWSFQEVVQLVPRWKHPGKVIDHLLLDWGSIASASAPLSIDNGRLYEKSDIEVGYSPGTGRRFVTYRREHLNNAYPFFQEFYDPSRDRARRSDTNSAWTSDKSFSQKSSGKILTTSLVKKRLFLRR